MMKKIIIMVMAVIILKTVAFADGDTRIIFEAGVGVMYESGIYKEGKNRIEPLPLINARYGILSFEYDRLKCFITDDFALTVGMGMGGYDDIEGMDKRYMAVTNGDIIIFEYLYSKGIKIFNGDILFFIF